MIVIDVHNVNACRRVFCVWEHARASKYARVLKRPSGKRTGWKQTRVNRSIWLDANQSSERILWREAICPACNRSRRWCAAVLPMTCRDMHGMRAHWSGNDHYFPRVFHIRERKIIPDESENGKKNEIRSIIIRNVIFPLVIEYWTALR